MTKFDDILAEGTNLSEEARSQIKEAWDSKLIEAREELTAELREEFAQKFEHDKSIMVESMDKFLNDTYSNGSTDTSIVNLIEGCQDAIDKLIETSVTVTNESQE